MTSGDNNSAFQAAVIITFLMIAIVHSGLIGIVFPHSLSDRAEVVKRLLAFVVRESAR
jgi:hypothetical protein